MEKSKELHHEIEEMEKKIMADSKAMEEHVREHEEEMMNEIEDEIKVLEKAHKESKHHYLGL